MCGRKALAITVPKATPFVHPAGLLGETNAPWSYTPPGGCSFSGNIP